MIELCNLPHWEKIALLLAYMFLEAWLGKTKTVKSNSLLELFGNLILTLFKRGK